MVRISAIFIAACMVLIAGSLGVVVYLRFGFTGAESALVALGTLTALAVYNAIAARKHDRLEASNQLANLARGSGDLARQLAEFGRRLSTVEVKVDSVVDRALATAQPLAAEIEEMSALVKQLADSVAAHEVAIKDSALALERRSGGRQRAAAERRSPWPPLLPCPPLTPARRRLRSGLPWRRAAPAGRPRRRRAGRAQDSGLCRFGPRQHHCRDQGRHR